MNNSKMACEEGDFETERTLVYTAKSKKVDLVVGHWKLEIGHCAFGHIEQYHDLLE